MIIDIIFLILSLYCFSYLVPNKYIVCDGYDGRANMYENSMTRAELANMTPIIICLALAVILGIASNYIKTMIQHTAKQFVSVNIVIVTHLHPIQFVSLRDVPIIEM